MLSSKVSFNRRPFAVALYLMVALFCMFSVRLGLAQGVGYWHTSGAQILDSNGARVRIAGISWYGFETTDMVAHGLNLQDYKTILQAIRSNGYNTVRIPFSNQMIESPIVPTGIAFSNSSGAINTDLQGLNSLQILDAIITSASSSTTIVPMQAMAPSRPASGTPAVSPSPAGSPTGRCSRGATNPRSTRTASPL